MKQGTLAWAALVAGGLYLLTRARGTSLTVPSVGTHAPNYVASPGSYTGTGNTNPLAYILGGVTQLGQTLLHVFSVPDASAPAQPGTPIGTGSVSSPSMPIPAATLLLPTLDTPTYYGAAPSVGGFGDNLWSPIYAAPINMPVTVAPTLGDLGHNVG